MIDKVRDTIKKHRLIENGDRLILGLSGGADSASLFHILLSLSKELGFYFEAVHINHLLRGEESDRDEEFVKDICNKSNIELHVMRIDAAKVSKDLKKSLEEAARDIRYEEFNRIAKVRGINKLAVAHNFNDQAETVLHRIIRGTGIEGLAGMKYISGNIIRPLLDVKRWEIMEFCSKNNIEYRVDSSNNESDYTRNKIRNKLIPFIENEINSAVADRLVSLSRIAAIDSCFMEEEAEKLLKRALVSIQADKAVLKLSELEESHRALQSRVLLLVLKRVSESHRDFGNIHVEYMIDFMINGRNGNEIHLPKGLKLCKSYGELIIAVNKRNIDRTDFNYELKSGCEIIIEETDTRIKAELMDRVEYEKLQIKHSRINLVQFFDYNKFKLGINIRNRRFGDSFSSLGSRGHKKLKKYFIDSKIPRETRYKIPLLTSGNQVAWIIGYDVSNDFAIDGNTEKVIMVESNRI